MKDYVVNIIATSVVAYLIATLTFLIGNQAGAPSIASAVGAGVCSGVVLPVTYALGQFFAGKAVDWKLIAFPMVPAVRAGMLGGFEMGL